MVSVLMSSYNGAQTIDRAIKSILNQTYRNFEFIICDDGSTDATLRHIKYFANLDHRIKIIHHSVNKGLQVSLNDCLYISKGSLIARMDDDDYSYRTRFQQEIDFLQNHQQIAFVGVNEFVTTNNIIYGQEILPKFPSKMQLFRRVPFSHPAIMIRASVLKNNHGYSTSPKYYKVEDYELWLRLYSKGYYGANIQKNLFEYNINLHNHSHKYHQYLNTSLLLLHYRKKLNIGIKGYFWIFLPLLKMLIPVFIGNLLYRLEFTCKMKYR